MAHPHMNGSSSANDIEKLRDAPFEFIYFIQTHCSPKQVMRLATRIASDSRKSAVLIGYNPTQISYEQLSSQVLSNVYFVSYDILSCRGEISLIEPYLYILKELKRLNVSYSWITYLSGQDYPLKNLSKIESQISNDSVDGYIDFWSEQSPRGQAEQARLIKRYYYKYIRLKPTLGKVADKLYAVFARLRLSKFIPIEYFPLYGYFFGIKNSKVPFDENFKLYRGYQWHTLSYRVTQHVLKMLDYRPDIFNYFKTTICSDEAFIQTLIANGEQFDLCNCDKRLKIVDNMPGGRPYVWRIDDKQRLIESDFFFARKFDETIDTKIMDFLDEESR